MTDATLTTTTAVPEAKATPRFTTRAATGDDLDLIHVELMNVIDESPHYNAEFKAWEKARLTKSYLKMLQRQDPWHVIALISEGKVGGALISGPEFGAIFRYWSWIFPAFRQTRLAYTFVRPENEVALALLRRYGYEQTCVLKNHIFGQDYCVMEKPYTKVTEGYDHGVGTGRLGRIVGRVNELLGR